VTFAFIKEGMEHSVIYTIYLLIYSVLLLVIDAEFGREDHGSIPAIAIGRGLKLLDVRTDPEPNSTVGGKKKSVYPNT
jgi:hypothetical protein